jgi:AcrR family transcriptional regulator
VVEIRGKGRPSRRPGVAAKKTRRAKAAPALPPTRKGSRSRENLKAAALRALERIGYRNLRLADIAEEAGVNISLVYHYYQDKAHLVFEALSGVINIRSAVEEDPKRPHDPFQALYHANLLFAQFYRDHPGLVRAVQHFNEEHPEFHGIYARAWSDWNRRIAETISRRFENTGLSEDEAVAVAFALGGMVDKFLFETYVERKADLLAIIPQPEDAARMLAVLWYRSLYLKNPDPADVGRFTGIARMSADTAS